jgi:hypothetical protein
MSAFISLNNGKESSDPSTAMPFDEEPLEFIGRKEKIPQDHKIKNRPRLTGESLFDPSDGPERKSLKGRWAYK